MQKSENGIRGEKAQKQPVHYVYILCCADHTLYTGWTTDLQHRLRAHNSGHGAKYTRSRRPVRLVYAEQWPTRNEALSREYAIKHLKRKEKEALVNGWNKEKVPVNGRDNEKMSVSDRDEEKVSVNGRDKKGEF